MKQHFAMFAAYNRWANARLYAAAGALPPEQFRADRGAFFGSLCGTLNHLLVTDRIWLRRLAGDGPVHTELNEIVAEDLQALATLRGEQDDRLVAFVDGLDEAAIAGNFIYRPITNPRDITQPRAAALAHLFNHQTHHRGQASAILTGLAGRDACPSLDLILFQRESGLGLS
ncbi:DinB family protein [Kaistia adipata]|uniref:DinB family protein n=1 Tax=Kaistia adipata TaxID=166954 RepID=UPI00041A1F9B|nr:DinB family protein [Kaistia adipata]